jgi:hypothetical protein
MSRFLLNLVRRGAGLPPEAPATPSIAPLFIPPMAPSEPEANGKTMGPTSLHEPAVFSAADDGRAESPAPVSTAAHRPDSGSDVDSSSQQTPASSKPQPSHPAVIQPEQNLTRPGMVQPSTDPIHPETTRPETDAGTDSVSFKPITSAAPLPVRISPPLEPALENPVIEKAAPAYEPPAQQRPARMPSQRTADATNDPHRSKRSPAEMAKIEQLVRPAPPTWSPPVLARPATHNGDALNERSVEVRIGTIEIKSEPAPQPPPQHSTSQPAAPAGFDAFHTRRNYVNWKDAY